MRADLERRLGPDAGRARDLLRPLAFAQGQGLPWENIWAPLASRISGHAYTDEDITWLRSTAGSYVVEATEAGRSAYRLYHQALTEYLRSGSDDGQHRAAFVDVLTTRVPRKVGGGRDWTRAHPYTLRYLATHAARGGRIDELIDDTDYLVEAAPDTLAPAIRTASTEHGQLIRTLYLASAGQHRHYDPPTRRQILAIDAARCGADAEKDALASDLPWRPRWATGTTISPALRATLTGHDGWVNAVACTVLDGVPVAVTGSDDEHRAGLGPAHRRRAGHPHRPRRLGERGGLHRAGRRPGRRHRQRRRHGAGLGPAHRRRRWPPSPATPAR